VALYGSNNTITNVTVQHARSVEDLSKTETFIISLNGRGSTSVGNLIHHCIVKDFIDLNGNGACSAISLNQGVGDQFIQGIVEDCEVYLTGYQINDPNNPYNGTDLTAKGGEYAYNALSTTSCIYRRNKAFGAQRGFNNDTWYNNSIVFSNNEFHMPQGVCWGFYLANGTTYSRFYENTVYLDGQGSSAFVMGGPWQDVNSAWSYGVNNLMLDHNHAYKTAAYYSGVGHAYNLDPSFPTLNGNVRVPPSKIHMENNVMQYDSSITGLLNDFTADQAGGYINGNTPSTQYGTQPNRGWQFTPLRADFNLDGTVDVIMQDSLDNPKVRYVAYNQDELIQPQNALGGYRVAGTGDVDRDGRTDLFIQAKVGYSYIGCWYMKGVSYTTGQWLTPSIAPGTFKIVAVGDFNHDGKPDLVLQDDSYATAFWYMDGATETSSRWLAPALAPYWYVVGTGDFNHDGNTDIVIQYRRANDYMDGWVGVWYLDSNQGFLGAAYLNPASPGDPKYQVVSVADFNNDGYPDIMFQYKQPNTDGGALLIWYLKDSNPNISDGIMKSYNYIPADPGVFNVMGPR
jgi:FG-GAP-like repeat